MNVKDSKRLSLEVQTQRSSLTVETTEFRRYSSGVFQEHKQKQIVSVQFEAGDTDGKKSPTASMMIKQQRSKDLNSSQESLSSPGLQRASPHASSTDLKESDDEAKEESPTRNSASESCNGSPDKPYSSFEILTNQESVSDGGEPSFTQFSTNGEPGALNQYEKRPSSAQDNYEMSLTPHGLRERSFERSLDNILDKCSEKSLDLNLSVDSWNSSVQEGGKSPDQQSGSGSVKASKSEKKKNRWYNTPSFK